MCIITIKISSVIELFVPWAVVPFLPLEKLSPAVLHCKQVAAGLDWSPLKLLRPPKEEVSLH